MHLSGASFPCKMTEWVGSFLCLKDSKETHQVDDAEETGLWVPPILSYSKAPLFLAFLPSLGSETQALSLHRTLISARTMFPALVPRLDD